MKKESKNKLSIIVPVYDDWNSLRGNIRSLKRYTRGLENLEVIFVNDCGPRAGFLERKIKKAINNQTNFKYFANKNNLGFVQNCNNAVFRLSDQESDVLLLNSDTKPTRGFLQEMQAVLYAEDNIAAVCPRSNAATIFSVPIPEPGKPYSMRRSYRIYKRIKGRLPRYYISPIAHGFCMMIRREVINKYGLFDEIYGKGYGEENDFCMRVHRDGWVCAAANKAYVFHFKARSFTEEKRSKLVEQNEKILDKRYPEYRTLIQEYLQAIVEPSS